MNQQMRGSEASQSVSPSLLRRLTLVTQEGLGAANEPHSITTGKEKIVYFRDEKTMKGLPKDEHFSGHWDTAQFYLVGEANKTFRAQKP